MYAIVQARGRQVKVTPGAIVEVDGEARGPKLRVFKKKRRKGFRKTRGHRSVFTRVRITDIQV